MKDKYDALKLNNQLCFPLYVCSKEIIKKYTPFLEEIDLTYTQYIAMMVLWEHRSITIRDLGRLLFLDSGTLTPLLKKMEKSGWLTRSRQTEDERVVVISLTEKGEQLQEQLSEVPIKMAQCVKLEQQEAMQLYELLNKMMTTF